MVYISCIEVYQGSSEAIPDIVSANVARARLTLQDTESQGPRVVYPQLARLAGAQVLNSLPSSTSPDCFLRRSTLRSWVHFFLETSLGGEGREDAMWGVHRVCCPSMWLTFSSRVGRDVLLSSDQTPWYLSHHKPKQPIPLCSWLHSAAVTAY